MGLKLAAWRREVGTALVAGWLVGPNLHRPRRNEEDARDQAGTSCGPGPAERIRRRSEAGECEAVGRVVGVGFVARREKKKKQIPRCARNDNLRAFGRAWAELKVEREWVPKAGVEIGARWDASVAGERRPEGRRYDGAPRLRSG
jgi:hypothetical protein